MSLITLSLALYLGSWTDWKISDLLITQFQLWLLIEKYFMVSSGILSLRTDAQFPQKSGRERFFRRGGNCIKAINFRIGNGYDNAGCDLVLKFVIKVKPLSKSLILSSCPLFSSRAIIKAGGTVAGGGGGGFPPVTMSMRPGYFLIRNNRKMELKKVIDPWKLRESALLANYHSSSGQIWH